jgi:hypothetical protein
LAEQKSFDIQQHHIINMIQYLDNDTLWHILSFTGLHDTLFVISNINQSLREAIVKSDEWSYYFSEELLMKLTHEPFRSQCVNRLNQVNSYNEMCGVYDFVTQFNYQSLVDSIVETNMEDTFYDVCCSHYPFHVSWIVAYNGKDTVRLGSDGTIRFVVKLVLPHNMHYKYGVYRMRGVLTEVYWSRNHYRQVCFEVQVIRMEYFDIQPEVTDISFKQECLFNGLPAIDLFKAQRVSIDQLQVSSNRMFKLTSREVKFSNIFEGGVAFKDLVLFKANSQNYGQVDIAMELSVDLSTNENTFSAEILSGSYELTGMFVLDSLDDQPRMKLLSITKQQPIRSDEQSDLFIDYFATRSKKQILRDALVLVLCCCIIVILQYLMFGDRWLNTLPLLFSASIITIFVTTVWLIHRVRAPVALRSQMNTQTASKQHKILLYQDPSLFSCA